VLQLQGIL